MELYNFCLLLEALQLFCLLLELYGFLLEAIDSCLEAFLRAFSGFESANIVIIFLFPPFLWVML